MQALERVLDSLWRLPPNGSTQAVTCGEFRPSQPHTGPNFPAYCGTMPGFMTSTGYWRLKGIDLRLDFEDALARVPDCAGV